MAWKRGVPSQERKRPRRGAMMLESDDLLDCITAAMVHSDFFSSCDDEEDGEFHKRSRSSTDSSCSLSSLNSAKEEAVGSFNCKSVRIDGCSSPHLQISPRSTRPMIKGARIANKVKQSSPTIPFTTLSQDSIILDSGEDFDLETKYSGLQSLARPDLNNLE